jgi:hypothetical protein
MDAKNEDFRLTLIRNAVISVVLAAIVGWINWGGIDRGTSDRFMVGFFTFMSVNGTLDSMFSRRIGGHPSLIRSTTYGAMGAACMVVALLTRGWFMIGCVVLALVGMGGSLVEARKLKRAATAGYRFPTAPPDVPR